MIEETKPDEIPQDPTLCSICQKGVAKASFAYICQQCYDDGWRAGKEMLEAIKKDPEFQLQSSEIFKVEVYKRLLREYYNEIVEILNQELEDNKSQPMLIMLDNKYANLIALEGEL